MSIQRSFFNVHKTKDKVFLFNDKKEEKRTGTDIVMLLSAHAPDTADSRQSPAALHSYVINPIDNISYVN